MRLYKTRYYYCPHCEDYTICHLLWCDTLATYSLIGVAERDGHKHLVVWRPSNDHAIRYWRIRCTECGHRFEPLPEEDLAEMLFSEDGLASFGEQPDVFEFHDTDPELIRRALNLGDGEVRIFDLDTLQQLTFHPATPDDLPPESGADDDRAGTVLPITSSTSSGNHGPQH